VQKRGLPRALMSDNGSAMQAEEFAAGLHALGILHEPTLPYSPYQYVAQKNMWRRTPRLRRAANSKMLNAT
jgi:transposase InsO family protein